MTHYFQLDVMYRTIKHSVVQINYFFTLISLHLPALEGQHNITALDLQIKSLREASLVGIREAACQMKEETLDIKSAVGDIEEWLERIKLLADEVPASSLSLQVIKK